jgi:hypothetical protein
MALIGTVEEFKQAERLFAQLGSPGETQEQFTIWWFSTRTLRGHIREELELLSAVSRMARRDNVYALEERRIEERLARYGMELVTGLPLYLRTA